MPRILVDPTTIACPDFASNIYDAARAPFVNANTTEEQAIALLSAIWKAGNDAERVNWQQQLDADAADAVDQVRVQAELETQQTKELQKEQDDIRKDDRKKNKSKYTPISDRGVPTIATAVAAHYAVRRMEKGLYTEMWYYTNDGLAEANRAATSMDDEAMSMVRQADGTTAWIPAVSARDTRGVQPDKLIKWEDFCQAVPRMIIAMEDAGWPRDRVIMMANFWGNLQVHEYRASIDPLDQRTLLRYQAEQRQQWHIAALAPEPPYNLARINDELMRKTRDLVYRDDRRIIDNEWDHRVRTIAYSSQSALTRTLIYMSSY